MNKDIDGKIPCPVKGSIECPFIKPCWYYGPDMRARLEKVREELHEADTAGNGGDLGGMQGDVRNALRMLEAILEGQNE